MSVSNGKSAVYYFKRNNLIIFVLNKLMKKNALPNVNKKCVNMQFAMSVLPWAIP